MQGLNRLNIVAATAVGLMLSSALAQSGTTTVPGVPLTPSQPATPAKPAQPAPHPIQPAQPAPQPATPAKPDAAAPAAAAPVADGKMGVVIEEIKAGEGAEAKAGSCVVVHLIGSIKGGEEIQNTVSTEKPVGVVLRSGPGGAAIKGFIPGITGMKVGGKRKLTIPAAAGFGDKETKLGTKTVPANSDLVYEVELRDMMILEDISVGTGAECKLGGAVVAHYKGTFKSDGREFDSSHKRGEPAGFALANVISGWTEGVPGMRIGGKRKLTIPSQFAYGERGRASIPPNSDLVFEIELVDQVEITDIKVGDGAEVPIVVRGAAVPVVKMHYRGTLKSNGEEFESSFGGTPIEYPLNQLIQGWMGGIPGMKVGGKRKLVIPWQLAYGEQGSPPKIGPRADLVFEVELLGVK